MVLAEEDNSMTAVILSKQGASQYFNLSSLNLQRWIFKSCNFFTCAYPSNVDAVYTKAFSLPCFSKSIV